MEGFEIGKIHPTAIVSSNTKIGNNVTIGPFSIIYKNVEIGNNTVVGPHSILGEPTANYYKDQFYENETLSIGSSSIIRSGAILYAGSTFGDHFECGHRVTVREKSIIGHHCKIGTLSDIQGDCTIANYVRIHGNIQIGQKSKIGNFVWIYPFTVLTNDPYPPSDNWYGATIEDYAIIASKVVILPGIIVGKNSLVGAMSLVRSNVPQNKVVAGNPAKIIGSTDQIRNLKASESGEKMYPWQERFDRGMPWAGIGYKQWKGWKNDAEGV